VAPFSEQPASGSVGQRRQPKWRLFSAFSFGLHRRHVCFRLSPPPLTSNTVAAALLLAATPTFPLLKPHTLLPAPSRARTPDHSSAPRCSHLMLLFHPHHHLLRRRRRNFGGRRRRPEPQARRRRRSGGGGERRSRRQRHGGRRRGGRGRPRRRRRRPRPGALSGVSAGGGVDGRKGERNGAGGMAAAEGVRAPREEGGRPPRPGGCSGPPLDRRGESGGGRCWSHGDVVAPEQPARQRGRLVAPPPRASGHGCGEGARRRVGRSHGPRPARRGRAAADRQRGRQLPGDRPRHQPPQAAPGMGRSGVAAAGGRRRRRRGGGACAAPAKGADVRNCRAPIDGQLAGVHSSQPRGLPGGVGSEAGAGACGAPRRTRRAGVAGGGTVAAASPPAAGAGPCPRGGGGDTPAAGWWRDGWRAPPPQSWADPGRRTCRARSRSSRKAPTSPSSRPEAKLRWPQGPAWATRRPGRDSGQPPGCPTPAVTKTAGGDRGWADRGPLHRPGDPRAAAAGVVARRETPW